MSGNIFDDAKNDDLQSVLIVGMDKKGGLHLYVDDVNHERMLALLERAKIKIARNMDAVND